MSSDEEPSINDIASELETQFVPRSDDDQVLWAVQEITAENGKRYKVKWAGTDPATRRPWTQSWVPKHDCTDDLVLEWKAKQKQLAERKKGGGRASTTSRSTKRGGSSTSGKRTRLTTSEVRASRSTSIQEPRSPPPKGSGAKRKRQTETPATTSGGAGKTEEQSEASRPHKKQKMNAALERLVPPLSSDEDEDTLPAPAKVTLQQKGPLKSTGNSSDGSDDDISPPPKAKATVRRLDVPSKGSAVGSRASDVREESRLRNSKAKAKAEVIIRPKEHVVDSDASPTSQDEEHPPQKSKKKLSSNRILPSEQNDDLPEKEKASPAPPIKIGPPRGIKRREALRGSGPSSKPGPSRIKPRKDNSDDGRVPTKKSNDRPGNDIPSFGKPFLLQEDVADSPTLDQPPLHLSIPPASLSVRPRNPDLSPGTRARLELFDRMIADAPQPEVAPPAEVSGEHAPDYTHFNYDDNYDIPDTSYPPGPLSPPPSRSKANRLEPDTPNGLIVPETESSGNSQSQTQSLDKLPPPQPPPVRESPRQSANLPTIAVIAASAESSPASPQDLFPLPRKPVPSINRPTKRPAVKPVPQISPNTFRSKIKQYVADAEAPPSSIESFTSPKRVDKGKQKAVDVDQLQSSPSETEELRKRPEERKITDSGLKKRGRELFDQVQLTREAERLKKKTAKQLKSVNDIVERTVPSPSGASPLLFTGGVENTMELHWEEAIDLTGGANSTTLDTAEHSEPKPPGEEERERLRIELRQEEEESTQEALGIYPPPPVGEPVFMIGEDAQMPPPKSPEHSSFAGQPEDVDHIEQPSTDLQLASVIVQPSQEQRDEDTDIDPSPVTHPTSSPPRRIPENLTDSPKRRLGEALSLLNVKSEEIQRLERELADESKNVQSLKAELAEAQQSSIPTGPVLAAWEAERVQWAQDRSKWEKDLAMWETQRKEWSDDKANLSARVAELLEAAARAEQVSVKLSELEAERVTWTKERDALQTEIAQRSGELTVLTKSRDENEQERLKWEAERVSWSEEKARWETERAALQEKQEASSRSVDELTTLVASLTSAKVSAEKDRNFFREQYTQASGFVTSVREENAELEERTKIAEGQAREGVAAIKAFYEGRIKTLQADVGRWKGVTELLQEKDRRTNDELRRRAAQVPELDELCDRLTAEKKSLEAEVRKLSRAQRRSFTQQNKLYFTIFALKKQRGSLKAKLSKLSKTGDPCTQETSQSAPAPPVVEYLENLDPNDMEILPDPMPQSLDNFDEPALLPCMWRPQWRDQCQHVFDAKEDLERHMQEHFRDLLSDTLD